MKFCKKEGCYCKTVVTLIVYNNLTLIFQASVDPVIDHDFCHRLEITSWNAS